jgi:hypothetical protein
MDNNQEQDRQIKLVADLIGRGNSQIERDQQHKAQKFGIELLMIVFGAIGIGCLVSAFWFFIAKDWKLDIWVGWVLVAIAILSVIINLLGYIKIKKMNKMEGGSHGE